MSEFTKKRVDYINNWPEVEQFEYEKKYADKCQAFFDVHKRHPYRPMPLWEDAEMNYNIAISFMIDSLEMMPKMPNHAFAFTYRGIDMYGKYLHPDANGKETKCLKLLVPDFVTEAKNYTTLQTALDKLFDVLPYSVAQYLYEELYGSASGSRQSGGYKRLTQNADGNPIADRITFFNQIKAKCGYDPSNYGQTIRKGSCLLRRIIRQQTIELNGATRIITPELKLEILLSGILYTLRNDYMHGLSISAFKSSMASMERYALNYYCFMAASTILDILLIMNGDQNLKQDRYNALKDNVEQNCEDFKTIFASHLN